MIRITNKKLEKNVIQVPYCPKQRETGQTKLQKET